MSIALGTFYLPWHLRESSFNNTANGKRISQTSSFTPVFFPPRHRAASSKCYIYSASLAWINYNICMGNNGASFARYIFSYWTVTSSCVVVCYLITICVCYLTIRARLNFRAPAMDTTHTKELSRSRTRNSPGLCLLLLHLFTFEFQV